MEERVPGLRAGIVQQQVCGAQHEKPHWHSVDRVWYCGVGLLCCGRTQRFRALLNANVVEMPHVPRRSIGLVLLSKGLVSSEQLQFAFEQSHMRGEELEATLVQLGFASERQLAAARAAQWGCPVLGQDGIGQTVEADIPPTLLETYCAAPIHASAIAKRMVLGFVYRVEHSLLNSLEQMTGLRVDPCFITPAERVKQMERLTASELRRDGLRRSLYAGAMAKNVAGFALEVAAREARFAHCRNYVWARLTGKRRKIDVLFGVKSGAEAGPGGSSQWRRSGSGRSARVTRLEISERDADNCVR